MGTPSEPRGKWGAVIVTPGASFPGSRSQGEPGQARSFAGALLSSLLALAEGVVTSEGIFGLVKYPLHLSTEAKLQFRERGAT